MSIKGYKVFNPDWTCRGFQYEIGKTYKHNGDIGLCRAGFHFCQRIVDCFNYYSFDANNKVAEVEAIGLVETDNNKSVTDKIIIVRELSWIEVLSLANTGKNCTGLSNTGNWNTGNCNTGNRNTGNCNTSDCNTGDCNTGNRNTGNCNTGNWNTGDCNTGNWNGCNFSSGYFNSIEAPLYVFNKPINIKREDFIESKGYKVLNWNYENNWWIYADNMSDEEKRDHPKYTTTGGYLKTVDFKTACEIMWKKLDDDEKQAVRDIPNFDYEVFKEITGIDAREDVE